VPGVGDAIKAGIRGSQRAIDAGTEVAQGAARRVDDVGTKEVAALSSTEVRAVVREAGTPFGKSGQAFNVGSESELNSLFQKITTGAENVSAQGYDGVMKILPDGTRIGFRNASTTGGQTIDVFPKSGSNYKVHITVK
jgi:hypothetical protein